MRLLILLSFFASSVSGQPLLVTNSFNNNSVADANAVNRNFIDIINGLNTRLNIYTEYPWNTAVGYATLFANTTGYYNTSVGYSALRYNRVGHSNTATGFGALAGHTSGNLNTAFGAHALTSSEAGDSNTAIGAYADVSGNHLTNATAIGYNATVDASYKIQLGNDQVISVATAGKLTTGAVTYPNTDGPAGEVLTTDGNGVASWAAAPDTLGSLNCTTGQLPKWNGNAWACAPDNDSLAAESCNGGQVLRWGATGWECSSASYAFNATELEEQVASLQEQLQSQQQELLAIVQSQQEQIAQLQRMVEHQFAMK